MDPALVEQLCAGTFIGQATIMQHEGKFIAWEITHGWNGQYPHRLQYVQQPFLWELKASNRGEPWYHIRQFDGRTGFHNNWYLWKCDRNDGLKLTLNENGGDDWESFRFVPHDGAVAMISMLSAKYVCANPDGHSIELIADRDQLGSWERFLITKL